MSHAIRRRPRRTNLLDLESLLYELPLEKWFLKEVRERPPKTYRLTINRAFVVQPKPTERSLMVGEAFGLGVDMEQSFPVYEDFSLEFTDQDVVYITGDSGSGKSVLLQEIRRFLEAQRGEVDKATELRDRRGYIDIAEIVPDPELMLIDSIGDTVEQAVQYLSVVGLNDAYLFLRRYPELSDGQKYRFRMAKMMESGAQFWIADEFCSTLDRETAKVVAYNFQKVARRLGLSIMVATTHRDLFEDLNPDIHVDKSFGPYVKLTPREGLRPVSCSLLEHVEFSRGKQEDYHKLGFFHYRAKRPWGIRKIFTAEIHGELAGVIVYSVSSLSNGGRTTYFGHAVNDPEIINREFLTISRVIVHPKYRSIGLGWRLVGWSLPRAGVRYVEMVAAMGRYNPFAEKAGMTLVLYKSDYRMKMARFCDEISERWGFNRRFMASPRYTLRRLREMSRGDLEDLMDYMASSRGHLFFISGNIYNRDKVQAGALKERLSEHSSDLEELSKILKVAAVAAAPKNYYIWVNQDLVTASQGKSNALVIEQVRS